MLPIPKFWTLVPQTIALHNSLTSAPTHPLHPSNSVGYAATLSVRVMSRQRLSQHRANPLQLPSKMSSMFLTCRIDLIFQIAGSFLCLSSSRTAPPHSSSTMTVPTLKSTASCQYLYMVHRANLSTIFTQLSFRGSYS